MTVKAGQKCTAIRRVFVPAERADAVADALLARLKKTTLGDTRREDVRMGPVVTRGQQAAAFDGIRKIAAQADILTGGATAPSIDGVDPDKSAFVAPTLMRAKDVAADAVHDTEVFGSSATIAPYRSGQEAFALR